MKRLSTTQMARKLRNDSLLTMGAKVLEKSIPYICEKPCATSLALNLATNPSVLYFTLKTHFDPTAFLS